MRKRAEKLTEGGKRRYTEFLLNSEVRRLMTALGGRIYERHERSEAAMADRKIQSLLKRIKRLETQIGRLENAGRLAGNKGPRKKALLE